MCIAVRKDVPCMITDLKTKGNIFSDMLESLNVTQNTFTKRLSKERTSLTMQLRKCTMFSKSTITTNICNVCKFVPIKQVRTVRKKKECNSKRKKMVLEGRP